MGRKEPKISSSSSSLFFRPRRILQLQSRYLGAQVMERRIKFATGCLKRCTCLVSTVRAFGKLAELCKLVHFQIGRTLVSSDQREIRQMPTSIFGAAPATRGASLPQDRDREDGGGGRKGSTQNCFPFLVKIGAARREGRKGESDQAITPFLELRSPPRAGRAG